VLKCLSLALNDETSDDYNEPSEASFEITDEHMHHNRLLREAGNVINDIVHKEIKGLQDNNSDLMAFNLMKCIDDTDSLLWEFISSCTRSVRERSGRANSEDVHQNAPFTTSEHYWIALLRIPRINTVKLALKEGQSYYLPNNSTKK
jgi:hypothetical protein